MTTTLDPKDPDVAATYSIDLHAVIVTDAARAQDFVVNSFVRPPFETGFYYEATTAGRTSAHFPIRWPRTAGETVQDGSVVWTARHPSSSTLPSISAVSWTVPAGLTLDTQSEGAFLANVTLSGGVDGEDYEVTARVTMSDSRIVEQSIIVPVRQQ